TGPAGTRATQDSIVLTTVEIWIRDALSWGLDVVLRLPDIAIALLPTLTTVVSFILVLGFLVFVHELGHYLAARHVGVRVERFSIGFPPTAIGRTIGETEYVLSWIPLGGYVKLYGQNIDDEDPTDPRNYAAKSKLQRLYILAAGPAMNLVAAVVLMAVVYMLGVETPNYRLAPPFY